MLPPVALLEFSLLVFSQECLHMLMTFIPMERSMNEIYANNLVTSRLGFSMAFRGAKLWNLVYREIKSRYDVSGIKGC